MTPAGGLSRVQTMRVCLQFTSPLALCSPPVRSCGAAGGGGGDLPTEFTVQAGVYHLQSVYPGATFCFNREHVLHPNSPYVSYTQHHQQHVSRGPAWRKHFRNLGTRSNPWLNLTLAFWPCL